MRLANQRGVVIAVGNQKGGVGKTTNTVHLAAALGLLGRACLIVDLDPHAGATRHLGVPENSFSGTLELLTTDESIEGLAIENQMPMGVHLIPARIQLSELDNLLSKFVDKTTVLDRPLEQARPRYDFIFLDTGPAPAFTTTVAAYAAAEWFLLSAFPHPLSLAGMTEAFNDIGDARKFRNPRLEVLGIVFTCVDGRATVLRNQLQTTVNEALPGRKFDTVVSQANILPTVSGQGKTLFQLPRFQRIAAVAQYLKLAVELEHRVRNRESFIGGALGPPDFSVLKPFGVDCIDDLPALTAKERAR